MRCLWVALIFPLPRPVLEDLGDEFGDGAVGFV
jgi:hypothetical protein